MYGQPSAAGFTIGRAHGIVWHNTRHSAVTNLVNAGVPKHEAKATSGQQSDEVFNRYSIGTEHQQQKRAGRVVPFTRRRRVAVG